MSLFFSRLGFLSHRAPHFRRSPLRSNSSRSLRFERLGSRELLAADMGGADDLAPLNDEFDDAATLSAWQRVNEVEHWDADQLQTWDIDQTQSGRMVMAPHTVVWYENWRGPMAFQEVTGDFVITSQVHITDRDDLGISDADDVPNEAQYSLGGLMIRTPRTIDDPATDWMVGSGADDGTNQGENYVFLSMGYGASGDGFSFEVKTTRNSNSQLELTPMNSDTATLQTGRIGDSIITLYRLPGEDWVVHRRFHRPDMPETLQVGLVSYSDWGKANDFDPFFHNSHVLESGVDDPTPGEPFNPDLVASFDFARYVRPAFPASLEGVDLVADATDLQLLSFLGQHANPLPSDDPDPSAATITLAATTPAVVEASGDSVVFTVQRSGESIADDVTVHYSVGGTATMGEDFVAVNGQVTLPAGSAAAWIDIAITDDNLIEGAESIAVQLLEGLGYELGESNAAVATIGDDDFMTIGDQTFSGAQEQLTIDLISTHPDGEPLSYDVQVVGSEAYQLDQQLGLYSDGNYHTNWGGQLEKWIQGDGGWYFLLPTGEFGLWHGSFAASVSLAAFEERYYDDPSLLHEAQSTATAMISDQVLQVQPLEGFVGQFDVRLTTSNAVASVTETFTVFVGNQSPSLALIADQTIGRGEGVLAVDLDGSDPDGDLLVYTAVVVQTEAYQLDHQYGFVSEPDFYENWGGQQEKWIRDAMGSWFYLLPSGVLHQWQGGFDSSPQIASLHSDVYADPTLLTEPEAIPAVVFVDGSTVVIDPHAEWVGRFDVQVTAGDGIATASREFAVTVSNVAPVIGPIADQVMTVGQTTLNIALEVYDADGDTVAVTAEVIDVAYELDQNFGFVSDGSYYTNWGGSQEKWIRNELGGWFFLLSNGELYRWLGSFEASEQVAILGAAYYEDPSRLTDAEPIAMTASIVAGELVIQRASELSGQFAVRISASDGFGSESQWVNVTLEA